MERKENERRCVQMADDSWALHVGEQNTKITFRNFSETDKELMQRYVEYQYRRADRSANSLCSDVRSMRHFAKFEALHDIENIIQTTYDDLNEFHKWMYEQKLAPSTKRRTFNACVHVIHWIQEHESTAPPVPSPKRSEKDMRQVGNSLFYENDWDLSPYDDNPQTLEHIKTVHFGYIQSESIRNTLKEYILSKLGTWKVRTVYWTVHAVFPEFIRFCERNDITSWRNLTDGDLASFYRYMSRQKNTRAVTYQSICTHLHSLIRDGQRKWEVPPLKQIETFYKQKRLGRYQIARPDALPQVIPDKVYEDILYHAIRYENDPYTKASLLIQAETGLSIGQVLSLKAGCVQQTFDGRYTLLYRHRDEDYKILVNNLVRDAVYELERFTTQLREESGLEHLFLYSVPNKRNKIVVLGDQSWNKRRYRPFTERFDIRGEDNKIYYLTSRQFADTFVSRVLKENNESLEAIAAMYPHIAILNKSKKFNI